MLSILLTAYKPPEWDLQRILSILIALIVLLVTLRFYKKNLEKKEEYEKWRKEELKRMADSAKEKKKDDQI